MFNNYPVDKFNLQTIIDLLDNGAKICVNGENNVLITILRQRSSYVKKVIRKGCDDCLIKARKNIIDLINLMISRGAGSPNYDILAHVIPTKNIELIKIISGIENLSNSSEALNLAI